MQTFLPYSSYTESARVLDNKRLGKQRSECLIILRTLAGFSNGWKNHPAVKMWKGCELSLACYSMEICIEWRVERKFNDTCGNKIASIMEELEGPKVDPVWLGNEDFHASHRAALLAKNFEWYSKFGWKEKPEIKYVWPLALGD